MLSGYSDNLTTSLCGGSPCLHMRLDMASPNPPPEWLKECAVVAAELTAVVYVLFQILRAVA